MHRPAIIIHLSAVMIIFIIIGCATLPKDFDRPESYALTDTEDTGSLDVDKSTDAVNIFDSQLYAFGYAQSAAIDRGQTNPIALEL